MRELLVIASALKSNFSRAGICKIVPPKEWVPRREGYNPADIEGIDIKPVQQVYGSNIPRPPSEQ